MVFEKKYDITLLILETIQKQVAKTALAQVFVKYELLDNMLRIPVYGRFFYRSLNTEWRIMVF